MIIFSSCTTDLFCLTPCSLASQSLQNAPSSPALAACTPQNADEPPLRCSAPQSQSPQTAPASQSTWSRSEILAADPLATMVINNQNSVVDRLHWCHHTFTHENLDNATLYDAQEQIKLNIAMAGPVSSMRDGGEGLIGLLHACICSNMEHCSPCGCEDTGLMACVRCFHGVSHCTGLTRAPRRRPSDDCVCHRVHSEHVDIQ